MNKTDEYVMFAVTAFIVVYVAAFIIGKITGKSASLTGLINLLTALLIMGYWVLRYFQVQVHIFDIWVTVLLLAETMLVLFTAYSMMVHYQQQWLRFIQYFFFGLYFLFSVLFLVFMLSFKMNRLF